MRRSLPLVASLALVLAVAPVSAGDYGKGATSQADAMKAHFEKCSVCKTMVPIMSEIMPVMKVESIKLDNGVAILHDISDPQKLKLYRKHAGEMKGACEKSTKLTDKQASKELCSICQNVRAAVKSGAQVSYGDTKTGDIMVMTSDDPKVQMQLTAVHDEFTKQMSQASR